MARVSAGDRETSVEVVCHRASSDVYYERMSMLVDARQVT
jgi:hypothetical protein